ncbi:MAG: hypothetical protein M1608_14505, partial [Candidatus Omnitrophica bacterium]|nr:hypothetical protein [Candidatus Omnitrophota bacterium]
MSLPRRGFLKVSTAAASGIVFIGLEPIVPDLWSAEPSGGSLAPRRGLGDSARIALDGFMSHFPEPTPRGYRLFFSTVLVPDQRIEHCQWDDGDGTARSLDAWWMLRAITGDDSTGRDVEQGQWRYLRNLLHPDTGLVYVADHCGLEPGKFYYHTWDQGRTFRHLVHRYRALGNDPSAQADVGILIRRMIKGLRHLSKDRQLPDGELATYFERDAYWN